MAGVGGTLLMGSASDAALLGVTFEKDQFALNGTTLLSDLPGYAGQSVYNIYAEFDNAADRAVGVVGSPTSPFSVFTHQGSGFFNVPGAQGGADTPPSMFIAGLQPALNFDTFFTIGAKFSDEFSTPLLVAPGTPGPNTDPWPAAGNPAATNMAWTLPPTLPNGSPPPETVAGPDGRVLLMRLSVMDQSKSIEGSFGLLWFDALGLPHQDGVSFSTAQVPVPGALALLGLAGLSAGRRRRRA
jgi:MYXO-CTERM domain-containing protein